jgi:hypothetical protein
MVHAPIANPQAANKFHTTPGIRHSSMPRGNDSPASASADQSHPRRQQHSADGRGNGLNPAQDEVQVWETTSLGNNKLAKSVSTIKHENLLGRLPPIWSSSNARLCLRCALIPVLLACYTQCVAKTR